MYRIHRFFREKQQAWEDLRDGAELHAHPLVLRAILVGMVEENTVLYRMVIANGWSRNDGDLDAITHWWLKGFEFGGRTRAWASVYRNADTVRRNERRKLAEEFAAAWMPAGDPSVALARAAFYESVRELFPQRAVTKPRITHWFGRDIVDERELKS